MTVILEKNSRDYPERISCINQTAERLAEFLNQHPKVKRVFYPKYQSVDRYDTLRKPGGGYGGLLSIELKCPEQNTPAFYDALKVNKGPTLGTDFTLVCPYTLLAHYEELEWVESCGVSRWLVRVSVGLEESSELIHRFSSALEVVS